MPEDNQQVWVDESAEVLQGALDSVQEKKKELSNRLMTEQLSAQHRKNVSQLIGLFQETKLPKPTNEERKFLKASIPIQDAIEVVRRAGYKVSKHN